MNKYSELQVNKAAFSDMPQIAKIHKESFSKEHTLSYFSLKTIEKYYSEFMNRPNVIYLVCKKDHELIGFVLGGEGTELHKAITHFQANNRYEVLFECIKNIFNLPFMKKIFSAYFNSLKARFKKTNYPEYKSKSDINMRMLSIAVKKNCKGKGIGSFILNSFESQLKQSGIKKYGLSVRKQNMSAIKFYVSKGFKTYKETNTGLYYYKDI